MQHVATVLLLSLSGLLLSSSPSSGQQAEPVSERCATSDCSDLTPMSLVDNCDVKYERRSDGHMYRVRECHTD